MPLILRKTISETFLERVRATPNTVGFVYKPTYVETGEVGVWKTVTFVDFYNQCKLISFGLMHLGVKRGDKVCILSNTRYEWSLCDMSILGAGAVTIPIYASSTANDVAYIIEHAESRVVILEDEKQLQKILDKKERDPQSLLNVEKIIIVEPSGISHAGKDSAFSKNILTLQGLQALGRGNEAKNPSRFEENLLDAKPDDLITICYTSGTTGVPKGAMITHDNMMSVLEDCFAVFGNSVRPEREITLSFLPFSHILGKAESMAVYVAGWKEYFAENLDRLMVNISEVKPTIIFAVPRIFEKGYNRVQAMVEAGSILKRSLFRWAFQIGSRYYQQIWNNKTPSLRDQVEYQLAKKLVFRKVAARFGGKLQFAVCGGAPLPKEIGEFFQIVGIKILEGYGLTETSAPVAINLPKSPRFGAVGKPLPEVTIKIADDGEILVKSRKVFKGYYKMPEESAQVLDGGWFHTGDIGHIDRDGLLHITDRKKDLIITSGGKNIAPQKIENLAKSRKLISQFVVQGDQKHYLTALVTLDRELVIQYANEHHILYSEYSELIKNQKIIVLVQGVIDDLNKSLASFETIKKFVILPNDFSVETGELTPSLKVKRNVVNHNYRSEINRLYAEQ